MKTFREKLAAGQPQIGLCVMYPSPGVMERLGPDWDFAWIDAQHGQLGYTDVLNLVRACDLTKTAALVRVPWLEAGAIGQALDTAAAGVIVPCIDSVEEAKQAVAAAKFPPLGRRSYGGRRPIDFSGRTYSDTANTDQLLILQIESPAAVEAADAIAAIDGVDALMIGPDDLLLRRGQSMTAPRSPELLEKDMRTIANAAHRHGKLVMGVGVGAQMFSLSVECGYNLIVAGGDVPFLATASKAASSEARQIIASHEQSRAAASHPALVASTNGANGPY